VKKVISLIHYVLHLHLSFDGASIEPKAVYPVAKRVRTPCRMEQVGSLTPAYRLAKTVLQLRAGVKPQSLATVQRTRA
jgi:hypothetical protein